MACIKPISLPPTDKHSGRLVPCGKCVRCMSRKKDDWIIRLKEERRHSSSAYFVTFTYNDDSLYINGYGVPSVSKSDIQEFFVKLKKFYPERIIRYYVTSEYGPKTLRPHYHAFIFNLPEEDVKLDVLSSLWAKGDVSATAPEDGRIAYCACYHITKDLLPVPENSDKNFTFMSKNPGIGSSYITPDIRQYHLNLEYDKYRSQGHEVVLPRYYKEKLFDKYTRMIQGKKYEIENLQRELDFVNETPFMKEMRRQMDDDLYLSKFLKKVKSKKHSKL